MSNRFKWLSLTLLAAIAGIAFAAGGFDRLKDTVKIGQGTTSDKVIEFDVGASPNAKITGASDGGSITSSVNFSILNEKSLKLFEATGGGTDSISIKAPSALAADVTLTLPADDGDANELLGTNGSGALDWTLINNSNVGGSAAIAYSKLNLTGSIVDADVNASAAISGSKLQAAGSSNAGAVTTGTQTIAGAKTFSSSTLTQGDATTTSYNRIVGGGSGYTASSLHLIANDTGGGSRGGGVYVWNDSDDSTMYFGTVYAENSSFGVMRKTSTSNSDPATIVPAADPSGNLLFKVQSDGSIRFSITYMYHVSGSAGSNTCTNLCGTEPAGAATNSGQCVSAWTSAKAVSTCAASAANQLCLCSALLN